MYVCAKLGTSVFLASLTRTFASPNGVNAVRIQEMWNDRETLDRHNAVACGTGPRDSFPHASS
jgi:hypothetical protein